MRLKRGDYVRVRLEGSGDEWTPAFVALASESEPSSVMLLLNGPVRARNGHGLVGGALPLTISYEHETATSLFGGGYEIEVAG